MHRIDEEVNLRLKVSRRMSPADDVIVIELRDPSGGDLPVWSPGAHIDLNLGSGLTRQYSLCGDPANRSVWMVAIRRHDAGTGGSERAHKILHEGVAVDVRGPRNHFTLEPARRYIFVAGGIGITPIMAMARAAAAGGADWRLAYVGRSLSRMVFADALQQWGGDRVSLHPRDMQSPIDLPTLLGTAQPETLVYCCGPDSLLVAVEELCARWPSDSLRVERFVSKSVTTPLEENAFEVVLPGRGTVLQVTGKETILEVLEAAGVTVPSSCRQGICGTCETPILSGTVDHRDALLTPEEQVSNETMMVCVSRATSARLVLDL